MELTLDQVKYLENAISYLLMAKKNSHDNPELYSTLEFVIGQVDRLIEQGTEKVA